MAEEFFLFRKFADIYTANEFAEELKKNNIEYRLQNNMQSLAPTFVATAIDLQIGINLRSKDFSKADRILEEYYSKYINEIDSDYYLFEFSTEELHEIISKPYEWGHLDYQLAKKILADKGEIINDDTIQKFKKDSIEELSQLKKVSVSKILIGYIMSVLFPFAGMFIGYGILNDNKILPNGHKFYLHSAKNRNHGITILTISIICFFTYFIAAILGSKHY